MNLDMTSLRKTFDEQIVLHNIDLELKDKHSLAIIGPSGGGKTTLLRILAGLLKPNSGKLCVNGEEVHFREKQLREYRKHMGMVFQAYNLFPHLTALGNIILPLEKVHGKRRDEAVDIALSLLDRFGLKDHADKKPAELSGGQKQRVALSRAMAIKPKILLLDEPTSALDPEYTSEVLDMIETLRSEGQDQILVTHEMGFARHVSDWVLLLSDGGIVEQGPPEEIFEHPKSPEAVNFFEKILKY
ncbi:MAG: amino acid ABC transporter ATP-binding protein [Spirochaetales bacterium]|nr:amino acid ABC transporter ATP-binding protein [Spirochaetales bacterium]